jgi:hypothetical protein
MEIGSIFPATSVMLLPVRVHVMLRKAGRMVQGTKKSNAIVNIKEVFMKKSKILVVGLIGLMLASGLVFIGCNDGGGYSGGYEITTYCGGYCGQKTSQCKSSCTRKGNASGKCNC